MPVVSLKLIAQETVAELPNVMSLFTAYSGNHLTTVVVLACLGLLHQKDPVFICKHFVSCFNKLKAFGF